MQSNVHILDSLSSENISTQINFLEHFRNSHLGRQQIDIRQHSRSNGESG